MRGKVTVRSDGVGGWAGVRATGSRGYSNEACLRRLPEGTCAGLVSYAPYGAYVRVGAVTNRGAFVGADAVANRNAFVGADAVANRGAFVGADAVANRGAFVGAETVANRNAFVVQKRSPTAMRSFRTPRRGRSFV